MKIRHRTIGGIVSAALEMPKEVALNIPLVSIVGCEEVCVENYDSLAEYSSAKIRLSAKNKTITITGQNLSLKLLSAENVKIAGKIENVGLT